MLQLLILFIAVSIKNIVDMSVTNNSLKTCMFVIY